jgi:hypothetical protein
LDTDSTLGCTRHRLVRGTQSALCSAERGPRPPPRNRPEPTAAATPPVDALRPAAKSNPVRAALTRHHCHLPFLCAVAELCFHCTASLPFNETWLQDTTCPDSTHKLAVSLKKTLTLSAKTESLPSDWKQEFIRMRFVASRCTACCYPPKLTSGGAELRTGGCCSFATIPLCMLDRLCNKVGPRY